MSERLSTGHANAICNTGIKSAYANGVLAIYGGASLPADLNAAITATLLCLVTQSGDAFTPGVATNGLNFSVGANGSMSKDPTENWRGTVLEAAGDGTTATFFVFYANDYDTTESSTAVRMAGSISSLSTAEMPIADPVLVAGAPFVVSNFVYTPSRS